MSNQAGNISAATDKSERSTAAHDHDYYTDPVSGVAVIGASIRGSSHEAKNTPCQDAYKIASGSVAGVPWLAVAVADGHGAAPHDRSHIGSTNACKVACDLLGDAARDRVLLGSNLEDFLRNQFRREMVQKWEAACKASPAQADEPAPFNLRRYGTTLSALLVIEQTVYCCRVGDSDLVRQASDEPVDPVFKDSEELTRTTTHSLASSNVHDHFDVAHFPSKSLTALFLSTDGLRNSFEDEQAFHEFLAAIPSQAQKFGFEPVAGIIPKSLEYATTHGSGDDITLLAMLFRSANHKAHATVKPDESTPEVPTKPSTPSASSTTTNRES